MAIFISQWLCPRWHCSIAIMWDGAKTTAAAVEERGEVFYSSGAIRRVCGICDGALQVEHAPTAFQTMAEAARAGKDIEQANLATRGVIDALKENKN